MPTVLIATDDAQLASRLEAAVDGEGYDPLTAVDGLEAIERVLTARPVAVLLDAKLPVYDGLTVAQQLDAEPDAPDGLPVFVLSTADIDPRKLAAASVAALLPPTAVLTDFGEIVARYIAPFEEFQEELGG
jgi:CheY-like chemotaxis protein